jgi:hypothetical protein
MVKCIMRYPTCCGKVHLSPTALVRNHWFSRYNEVYGGLTYSRVAKRVEKTKYHWGSHHLPSRCHYFVSPVEMESLQVFLQLTGDTFCDQQRRRNVTTQFIGCILHEMPNKFLEKLRISTVEFDKPNLVLV